LVKNLISYLIIRNDASDLFFFGYLAGRPMTGDGSTSIAIVYHTLSRFLPFIVAIADIHLSKTYK
jgi:hypothetical protein